MLSLTKSWKQAQNSKEGGGAIAQKGEFTGFVLHSLEDKLRAPWVGS